MTSVKFVPYEMKTSVISVYSYEDKVLRGAITNPYFEQPVVFDNAIQLILLVDELQDAINFPLESTRTRSFATTEGAKLAITRKAAPVADVTGRPLASFKLNIMFRQNSSWQGGLVWIEGNAESQFRSLLELIMLLDGALTDVLTDKLSKQA
ncbi:MAG: hypothetical protein LBS51_02995 [Oscillospiraceae bacterium]|jgi:hypothetical protein|nr:hypothetical protein [Oscillospiraceae bacterium]